MKMKDNCPYCNKNYCIPDVAFLNCEQYGNNSFTVKCNHCGKILDVCLSRIVVINYIDKSDKKSDETDW